MNSCKLYKFQLLSRGRDLDVGENCFILDNQSISLDVKIGNNVVMWSSNHIGDLSTIGDHSWLASHVTVAAEVTVQPYCFLGIGATIGNKPDARPADIRGSQCAYRIEHRRKQCTRFLAFRTGRAGQRRIHASDDGKG